MYTNRRPRRSWRSKGLVLGPELPAQPADRAGRQRGVLTDQQPQGRLEVPRGQLLDEQVQKRRVERVAAPLVLTQHLGLKRLLPGRHIPHPRHGQVHGAGPEGHGAAGRAVALAAELIRPLVAVPAQIRLDFFGQGRHQHLPGAFPG